MPQQTRGRCGATGPRSAMGKARSSGNSAKHGIFREADERPLKLLDRYIRREIMANGAAEIAICRQIARNLIERESIEQFFLAQSKKASTESHLKALETMVSRRFSVWHAPVPLGTPDGVRPRLRARFLSQYLSDLKNEIENRGVSPIDVKTIDDLYGDLPTILAQVVRSLLVCENELRSRCEETGAQYNPAKGATEICRLLSEEMKFCEFLDANEACFDDLAYDLQVADDLPSDQAVDKLIRYRAANSREFARALTNLEAWRHLKISSPDAENEPQNTGAKCDGKTSD